MAYNNLITRTEAEPLIPEDVSRDIISHMMEDSAIMKLARRVPDMPRRVRRLPVLDVLPSVDFVNATGGYSGNGPALKQTSEVNWSNKYLYAEELAVIIPIPEIVADDVDYDIWEQIQPALREAFAVKFDQTVLWAGSAGYVAPTDWPAGIATQAIAAGNYVTAGSGVDLYEELLGGDVVEGVWGKVEEDGYEVTGAIAALNMKRKLRAVRSSEGVPIFNRAPETGMRYEIDGVPALFPKSGIVDTSLGDLVAGDFSQLLYSFRQDLTWKILDQAVITDAAGAIIFNLAQQDMVALRAVMRIAWVCPNPTNRANTNANTRFPFAVHKA